MNSFDQFKKYIHSWCGGQKCTQCMPYPTSAASHLKCLLPLFVSAYICMCCFYFSAAYVLMCFNFIYVLLCFVLCFYIWFWIAFQIIAGVKTASPNSEAWFNPGMAEMSLFRMHLGPLSTSCYIWSLLYFYYFVECCLWLPTVHLCCMLV